MLPFAFGTRTNFLGGVVDSGVMYLGLSDSSSLGEKEPGGKKLLGHPPPEPDGGSNPNAVVLPTG